MSCNHSISFWIEDEWVDDYGAVHNDSRYETEETFKDIDLHRYKCTQCNEIFYYSQAASDYYENGIKSDISGLDK